MEGQSGVFIAGRTHCAVVPQSVCSTKDGRSGSFEPSVTVNAAGVRAFGCEFGQMLALVCPGLVPGGAGVRVGCRNVPQSSRTVEPATSRVGRPPLPRVLVSTCYCQAFYLGHPAGCARPSPAASTCASPLGREAEPDLTGSGPAGSRLPRGVCSAPFQGVLCHPFKRLAGALSGWRLDPRAGSLVLPPPSQPGRVVCSWACVIGCTEIRAAYFLPR